MKNFLKIFLIISVSYLIFNVDNVFAYCSKSLILTKNQATVVNTYGMDKSTVMEIVNSGYYSGSHKTETLFVINSIYTLREYYEKNLKKDYKYYFIGYSAMGNSVRSYDYYYPISSFYLSVFNDENIDSSVKGYFTNSHNHYKDNNFNPFNISYSGVSNYTYYKFDTGNDYFTLTGGTKYTNQNMSLFVRPTTKTTNYSIYFETNYSFDIYLNDNDNSNTLSNLTYDDNLYLPGDYITNSLKGLGVPVVLPRVNFELVDTGEVSVNFDDTCALETVKVSETYKISYSTFNTEKYKYYVSSDGSVWNYLNREEYEITFTENGTFNVKVVDLEGNEHTQTLNIVNIRPLNYIKVLFNVDEIKETVITDDMTFTADIVSDDDVVMKSPYVETIYKEDDKYFEKRYDYVSASAPGKSSISFYWFKSTAEYYNYVVDMINYPGGDLDFTFTNNTGISYKIIYYYADGTSEVIVDNDFTLKERVNENIVKIDLTDKLGIMIYPITYSNNDVFSNFYGTDVEHSGFLPFHTRGGLTVRTYNRDNELMQSYNCSYYDIYKHSDLNGGYGSGGYLLVKHTSTEFGYIYLDTNRFVYTLIENSSDIPTIVNPSDPSDIITGPSMTDSDLQDKIFNSSSEDYENSEYGMGSITQFINDMSSNISFVHQVFDDFYNSLPDLIKGLLIVIFNVLCINVILRLGGWLG